MENDQNESIVMAAVFSIPQSNGTKVPQEQGIKSYIKLLNIILNYIIVNDIKLC